MAPRLELRDISKVFPGVKALERVSLDVMPGEVHALLGENGAGKSTLGKIIAGVYARDEGSVTLDGVPLGDIDEVEAGRLGVGIVHQEGSLVRTLSIADNIFAGRQPTRSLGRVDVEAMVARSRALLEQLGVHIDPKAKVATLSSAQAQVVEIAKALSQDLRLLILDEPTAALTLTESERLFEAVRRLKANGVSIVYVSHRLAEIFTVCDRVSVLKDGRLSGTREVAATSTDELIRLMVGRDIVFSRQPGDRASGPPILEVERLSAEPFAGLCAGDLHIYLGKNPYVTFPRVGGHEIAGVISAVGPGVKGVAIGERVVVEPFIGCGHCCPCRIGKRNCCANLSIIGVHRDGGFAERVIAPAANLHPIPSDMSDFEASFAEPVAIGVQACRRGEVTAGDRVLVLGAGPIGLAIGEVARARRR